MQRNKSRDNKRRKPKNTPTIANLTTQIRSLQMKMDGERKQYDIAVGATVMGQFLGASTQGALSYDVTPIPAQGTTHITRTGECIKVLKGNFRMFFDGMSAHEVPTKVRILLLKIKGEPVNVTTALNTYLENNDLSNATIRDYYSRFAELYRDNWVKLLDKVVIVPGAYFGGQANFLPLDFNVTLRNHRVWMSDSSTTVRSGQLVLMFLADSGNASAVTATTATGAPIVAVNTGVELTFTIEWDYADN